MTHRLFFIKKVFSLMYELLFAFLTIMFLHNIFFRHTIGYASFLPTIVIFVLSYIIRNKISNYGLIVFGHILMFVPFFTSSIWYMTKFIFLVIIVYLTVVSCKYVHNDKRMIQYNGLPWPSFLFCLIYYLFTLYMKKDYFYDDIFIITFIMLLLHLINVYMTGIAGYINNTKDTTGVPINQIIKINTIYVGCIILVFAVSVVFMYSVDIKWMFNLISEFFKYIFKIIFYGFHILSAIIQLIVKNDKSTDKVGNLLEELKTQAPVDSGSIDTIILVTVFTVFLVIFLYLIVKKIIKYLLSKGMVKDDLVEKADVSVIDIKNDYPKRSLFGLGLTMEEKARRLYKKRIYRYKNDIRLDEYITSKEIMTSVEDNELGDVSEISELYSDIRYGNTKVDKAVLKNMNKLYKQ